MATNADRPDAHEHETTDGLTPMSYAEARKRALQMLVDAEKERGGRDHRSVFTDMADALAAAEAQVARLRAQVADLSNAWTDGWDCSASPGHEGVNEAFARVARDEWPADLLAAVDRLTDSNCDCTLTAEEAREPQRQHAEAIAVLVRYGLLPTNDCEGAKKPCGT